MQKWCTMLLGGVLMSVTTDLGAQGYDSVPLRRGVAPSCTIAERMPRYASGVVFDACEADYILMRADPHRATGQGVVICPGGGYAAVVFDHEGLQVARWLNAQGVTAMILRYRMPFAAFPERPMEDAASAIAMMRDSAATWGVDTCHVGIMGFSAGGHLAAMQSVAWNNLHERPDFTLLFYPVISMVEGLVDEESRDNLLGLPPTHEVYDRYSCEKRVNSATPPAFIAASDDDDDVDSRNSTFYYLALKRVGVPATMHIYSSGRHGWGWNPQYAFYGQVTRSLGAWLQWELHRTGR